MARRRRLYVPGVAHHIIQRGNNREACFYEESDYKAYLALLKENADKHKVAVHAFVLMTNHVHLLCTPNNEIGNSRLLQSVGRRYVQLFNSKYGRTGTLWEGRFKSTLVQSEKYLLNVYRYIELNPVRAGMVKQASEHPWSSYRCNAMGKNLKVIAPHAEYLNLGLTDEKRQEAYRALFRGHVPEATIKEIRDGTNKARIIGDGRFRQEITIKAGLRTTPFKRGGDRKSTRFQDQQNQLL